MMDEQEQLRQQQLAKQQAQAQALRRPVFGGQLGRAEQSLRPQGVQRRLQEAEEQYR